MDHKRERYRNNVEKPVPFYPAVNIETEKIPKQGHSAP